MTTTTIFARRWARLSWILPLMAVGACGPDGPPQRVGTAELREALFDTLVVRMERRDARSPFKGEHWGEDTAERMAELRDEVVAADTEEELFYALRRVSNLRRDRHLDVTRVEGGLRVLDDSGLEGGPEARLQAPVRIFPDYRDTTAYFVADVSVDEEHFPAGRPEPGARVLAVDGVDIDEYVAMVEPYHRASYRPNQRWLVARGIGSPSAELPAHIRGVSLELTVENPSGDTVTIQLPYLDREEVAWAGFAEASYPGFRKGRSTPTWDLWLPEDDREVLLLTWHGFGETVREDVDTLVSLAQRRGWLDRGLILDASEAEGGEGAVYALRHLRPQSFRPSLGNLRLSDAAAQWVEARLADAPPAVAGLNPGSDVERSWILEWFRHEVRDSLNAGAAYSNAVAAHMASSGGSGTARAEWVDPAPVHFRGPMVAFFAPRGGSELDRFAAMLKDNGMAHLIGMTPGGFSNSWTYGEVLRFPGTEQPVVRFEYTIGNALRPNGQVLESNPALPHEWVTFSASDYRAFHTRLVERAEAHLEGAVPPPPVTPQAPGPELRTARVPRSAARLASTPGF